MSQVAQTDAENWNVHKYGSPGVQPFQFEVYLLNASCDSTGRWKAEQNKLSYKYAITQPYQEAITEREPGRQVIIGNPDEYDPDQAKSGEVFFVNGSVLVNDFNFVHNFKFA